MPSTISLPEITIPKIDTSSIMANLSPTLFEAGGKDIVATPDIYGIDSNVVINTAEGKFKPVDTGILDSLKNDANGILSAFTNSIGDIGSIKKLGREIGSLGTGAVLHKLLSKTTVSALAPLAHNAIANVESRIGSALGIPISSLPMPLKTNVSMIENVKSSVIAAAFVKLGDVVKSIPLGDDPGSFDSSKSLIGITNHISGNDDVTIFDAGAQTAVLKEVTGQLIRLGLSEVVTSLMDSQKDHKPTVANGKVEKSPAQKALEANIKQAIDASDLSTIELCITYLGAGGVLSKVPNAGKLLLKHYRIPKGTKASEYVSLYGRIKNILDTLNVNWSTMMRGGTKLPSLAFYSTASDDALKLMKLDTDPDRHLAAVIGRTYTSGKVKDRLSELYPYMLKL